MIQTEGSEINYLLRDPALQLPVRLRFLESGLAQFARQMHFDHPSPPFNRVFLFRAGGCRVRMGSHVFRLSSGQLYLLPAGQSFEVDYRAGSELRFFHVQAQDFAGLDMFRSAFEVLRVAGGADLAQELTANFPGDGARRLRWQSALLQTICRVGAPFFEQLQPRMEHAARYRELLDFIRKQCDATMTVAQLAQRMRRPRAALSKSFQRSFGIPLKKHLQDVLLQRAKERLAGTDAKVQDVALDLGFSDAYYFFRFFKKHTAQTPLEYRRRVAMPG